MEVFFFTPADPRTLAPPLLLHEPNTLFGHRYQTNFWHKKPRWVVVCLECRWKLLEITITFVPYYNRQFNFYVHW